MELVNSLLSAATLALAAVTLKRVMVLERNMFDEFNELHHNMRSRINAFLDVFRRSKDK